MKWDTLALAFGCFAILGIVWKIELLRSIERKLSHIAEQIAEKEVRLDGKDLLENSPDRRDRPRGLRCLGCCFGKGILTLGFIP